MNANGLGGSRWQDRVALGEVERPHMDLRTQSASACSNVVAASFFLVWHESRSDGLHGRTGAHYGSSCPHVNRLHRTFITRQTQAMYPSAAPAARGSSSAKTCPCAAK